MTHFPTVQMMDGKYDALAVVVEHVIRREKESQQHLAVQTGVFLRTVLLRNPRGVDLTSSHAKVDSVFPKKNVMHMHVPPGWTLMPLPQSSARQDTQNMSSVLTPSHFPMQWNLPQTNLTLMHQIYRESEPKEMRSTQIQVPLC